MPDRAPLLLGPAEDDDDEEEPAGDGDEGQPEVIAVGIEPFADDPFAPAGFAALAHGRRGWEVREGPAWTGRRRRIRAA